MLLLQNETRLFSTQKGAYPNAKQATFRAQTSNFPRFKKQLFVNM